MKGLDAVAGEFQRFERVGIAGLRRGIDLVGRDAQAACVEREPVEFAGGFDQRGIAARDDVVDDRTGGALDIRRDLALGGEELTELLVEIGAGVVEANGHPGLLGIGGQGPLLNGAAAYGRQPLYRLALAEATGRPESRDGRGRSGLQRGRRGAEIIRAEVGQFAFQAFQVQPQHAAVAEQQ